LTHFISVREKFHSNLLGLHVQTGNWLTTERLKMLTEDCCPRPADWMRPRHAEWFAGLVLLVAVPQIGAAEVRHITLEEAIHLAMSGNRALKLARLKIEENQQNKAGNRSAYFPPS
jgi:hypothetical protein